LAYATALSTKETRSLWFVNVDALLFTGALAAQELGKAIAPSKNIIKQILPVLILLILFDDI
jgi:hypothetical protein